MSDQTDASFDALDAYWRAANYLSVGQIYLRGNALLREKLTLDHIKPRLLGHWGTTPGLNFVYAHLNRVIRARDLNILYVCGPGHGGPGMVANTWLEGTYTELYPAITQDAEGMHRLFLQFSWPGGIPSHAAPDTPGSINEGGELGYSLRARLWRGVRQPRPDRRLRRRRRRGRDRRAGHQLAQQQIPQPAARRRRAADPASQRLQDRRPHRARPHAGSRAAPPVRGLRLRAGDRRRRRPGRHAPTNGRRPRPRLRRHRRRPARRPARRRPPPRLANADPAHAKRLDRPERGRRQARRRHLARPPGPARRAAQAPGAPRPARALDARIRAGEAVRRRRPAQRRHPRPGARPGSAAWAPTRTPMAACCCAT